MEILQISRIDSASTWPNLLGYRPGSSCSEARCCLWCGHIGTRYRRCVRGGFSSHEHYRCSSDITWQPERDGAIHARGEYQHAAISALSTSQNPSTRQDGWAETIRYVVRPSKETHSTGQGHETTLPVGRGGIGDRGE